MYTYIKHDSLLCERERLGLSSKKKKEVGSKVDKTNFQGNMTQCICRDSQQLYSLVGYRLEMHSSKLVIQHKLMLLLLVSMSHSTLNLDFQTSTKCVHFNLLGDSIFFFGAIY